MKKAAELRDREAIASTRSATISRIQDLSFHGREFLERVRSETEEPLLMLQGEAGEAMPDESASVGVHAQMPSAS